MNTHHYAPPHNTGLDIVYQDETLLLLNKPAGLLSVPGRGADKQDSLIRRVQAEYPQALIVHRLDMATSGLILIALNQNMQRQLSRMFEQRQIEKCYIAVVDGELESRQGEIDFPLITDWPRRPRQKVDYETGKPALTLYQVLDYHPDEHTSRVELKPQTGRTHQLRIHMASIGHAILGDHLYATSDVQQRASRLLLHAAGLSFTHPEKKTMLNFSIEVPF